MNEFIKKVREEIEKEDIKKEKVEKNLCNPKTLPYLSNLLHIII